MITGQKSENFLSGCFHALELFAKLVLSLLNFSWQAKMFLLRQAFGLEATLFLKVDFNSICFLFVDVFKLRVSLSFHLYFYWLTYIVWLF